MDRQQARRIIQETFEKPFDKNRFTHFIKNLLNRIEEAPFAYHGQFIPEAYRQYISTLERIGKFNDGENRIDILVIKLQRKASLERARTNQRNFVAGYLQGKYGSSNEKEAALVAFVSPDEQDWRFSLVRMDYKFEQTPTGKTKVKEEFTPARRWSFLVGVNERSHTAQSRLEKILADDENNPTLAQLEDAFNIETVTKEFFLKYRDLFIRTKEGLDKVVNNDAKIKADFEANGVNAVDFAKKLLGQIVFLYFLQKKGWFGVARDADWGAGSKQFLRELFEKKHSGYKNFFNDILEPLFYEALRVGEERQQDDYYYSRFNCKIPFLNGGLFDPIGNYDWVKTDILLPDSLFSNQNKTREGDTGDGILDVFDRYNFTVKEDEPLEKEVAIDPELLGKAYEKFNAIRPDNFEEYKKALKSGRKGDESKFNKQFGVYYTPREIVHYMCQQSLINYLFTELNSGTTSYEKLDDSNLDMLGNEAKKGQLDITIKHRENPEISKEDIETLIHLGEQVSENEEIALLKENLIEQGKQKTTKNKLVLPEGIRKNAELIDQKLEAITVCDPAVGSGAFPVGMMNEIVKARNVLSTFIQDKKRTTYDFKRQCIEHSLYGVDIDPGAVEIAKLRLWLSLVVDEESIENIKPLPNLDYKIVCGNSLLGVEKNLFNNQFFIDLEKLKPLYFNETNPTKKQGYKTQIDNLISQLTNGHKEFDFEVYFSEVFHHKGGFDVVIANPPYGVRFSVQEKQVFLRLYHHQDYQLDSYLLFLERGFDLLHTAAVLAYIIPNPWLINLKLRKIRHFLFGQQSVREIVHYARKVFDATVDTEVVIISKEIPTNNRVLVRLVPDAGSIVDRFVEQQKWASTGGDPVNIFADSNQEALVEKMRVASVPMKELCEVLAGMSPYEVGKGTPRQTKSDVDKRIYDADHKKDKTYRPLLRGRDIDRYVTKWDGHRWIKYGPNLAAPRRVETFDAAEKIVIRQTGDSLIATLDSKQFICMKNMHTITQRNKTYDLKFILGLLNSRLLNYYFQWLNPEKGEALAEIKKEHVENLVIKATSEKQRNQLIEIVDKILAITKSSYYLENPAKKEEVKEYEKQIDQLVYQLYGLSEEEIKIVESSQR